SRPRLFRMGRVISRPRLQPLGPVGLAGAVLGGVMLAMAAIMTLGLALLLRPRGRPRRGAAGGAPTGATAGGSGGAASRGAGASRGGEAAADRERSYAEVIEAWPIVATLALGLSLAGAAAPAPARAGWLVPMDEHQTDHLRAYGLAYWVLARGQKCEWLLHYRRRSFLLKDDPRTDTEANQRGGT